MDDTSYRVMIVSILKVLEIIFYNNHCFRIFLLQKNEIIRLCCQNQEKRGVGNKKQSERPKYTEPGQKVAPKESSYFMEIAF